MTGPPLSISMDFIAVGLVEMIGGLASAALLFGYAWWAPLLLGGAWLATHWLLRDSAIWRDRNTEEVRSAQRDADYAYRLAVDPPAAKELRIDRKSTRLNPVTNAHLVCRLLLEKKNKKHRKTNTTINEELKQTA